MNTELNRLINRAELAAERAERDGFVATAEALRGVAITLANVGSISALDTKALQYNH